MALVRDDDDDGDNDDIVVDDDDEDDSVVDDGDDDNDYDSDGDGDINLGCVSLLTSKIRSKIRIIIQKGIIFPSFPFRRYPEKKNNRATDKVSSLY